MDTHSLRLLTIDLDDTLWPCAPVIRAAEQALFAWLEVHAPGLAAHHDATSLRAHRRNLMQRRPEIAHDLTAVRACSLRELLPAYGYDPQLADAALAVFLQARNRVQPYPGVSEALQRLRRRFVLVAVTNGNADVESTPLAGLFHAAFTAGGVGAAKPNPEMFRAALAWARIEPGQAMHVGDDPERDVAPAMQFGMATAWVAAAERDWPQQLERADVEVRHVEQLAAQLLA